LGYATTPGIKNIVIQEENLYEIRNHKITVTLIMVTVGFKPLKHKDQLVDAVCSENLVK